MIEGQATLSIPTQRAYDAILGLGELKVCGPEDDLRWELQRRRNGTECRLTRRARNCSIFSGLAGLEGTERSFDEMFPWPGSEVLKEVLKEELFGLYRGYFSWRPLRRRRLHWTVLARTNDRKFFRDWRFNHPTLLMARHGKGVVFASTMLLPNLKQERLLRALFQAHGRMDELPQTQPWRLKAGDVVRKNLVPISVTAIAGPIAGIIAGARAGGALRDLTRGLLVLIGIAVVAVLAKCVRGAWRLGKEAMGE